MKKHYWISPIGSKKNHIHDGDGMALCNNWMMLNCEVEVLETDTLHENDCKICWKRMNDEKKPVVISEGEYHASEETVEKYGDDMLKKLNSTQKQTYSTKDCDSPLGSNPFMEG